MRVEAPGRPHLSYCTNIHPAESLAEVRTALEQHVVRVKARLDVKGPFGVGLRLSARAASELAARLYVRSRDGRGLVSWLARLPSMKGAASRLMPSEIRCDADTRLVAASQAWEATRKRARRAA